ncbi:hypothetical protein SAMN05444695_11498 [Rhodococcus triatomae]|uniref:Uncharacterized protein n=1 Tax=Rhodococcus triatomae TaxID=300028 RepID=A0A1G8Q7G9_9NOCA|nr:hypothetical protein SAMN05444695_11498 [Rhodococcus triatomae]
MHRHRGSHRHRRRRDDRPEHRDDRDDRRRGPDEPTAAAWHRGSDGEASSRGWAGDRPDREPDADHPDPGPDGDRPDREPDANHPDPERDGDRPDREPDVPRGRASGPDAEPDVPPERPSSTGCCRLAAASDPGADHRAWRRWTVPPSPPERTGPPAWPGRPVPRGPQAQPERRVPGVRPAPVPAGPRGRPRRRALPDEVPDAGRPASARHHRHCGRERPAWPRDARIPSTSLPPACLSRTTLAAVGRPAPRRWRTPTSRTRLAP